MPCFAFFPTTLSSALTYSVRKQLQQRHASCFRRQEIRNFKGMNYYNNSNTWHILLNPSWSSSFCTNVLCICPCIILRNFCCLYWGAAIQFLLIKLRLLLLTDSVILMFFSIIVLNKSQHNNHFLSSIWKLEPVSIIKIDLFDMEFLFGISD